MKAKRIAILISMLCIILVFVLLSSTVFSLSRVEFCFLKQPLYYSSSISNDVIHSGEFKIGDSVFLIDKQNHILKIEKEFPYLKIVGIETVFPNILVIQSIEREQLFAVANNEKTKIAICDQDFKILRIIEWDTTPQYPLIENCNLSIEDLEVGDFIKISSSKKYLLELGTIFQQINYTPSEVARLIKKITVQQNGELLLVSYNNYRIEISVPEKFLLEKVALGYQTIYDSNKGVGEDYCGLIKVFQNKSTLYANTILNG